MNTPVSSTQAVHYILFCDFGVDVFFERDYNTWCEWVFVISARLVFYTRRPFKSVSLHFEQSEAHQWPPFRGRAAKVTPRVLLIETLWFYRRAV